MSKMVVYYQSIKNYVVLYTRNVRGKSVVICFKYKMILFIDHYYEHKYDRILYNIKSEWYKVYIILYTLLTNSQSDIRKILL